MRIIPSNTRTRSLFSPFADDPETGGHWPPVLLFDLERRLQRFLGVDLDRAHEFALRFGAVCVVAPSVVHEPNPLGHKVVVVVGVTEDPGDDLLCLVRDPHLAHHRVMVGAIQVPPRVIIRKHCGSVRDRVRDHRDLIDVRVALGLLHEYPQLLGLAVCHLVRIATRAEPNAAGVVGLTLPQRVLMIPA